MGDISIIARRLKGGEGVQYGWSGNGGYFSMVGSRLLQWYNNPEKVEYLFELGQLKLLGKPDSERGGMAWFLTHQRTGEPHWKGETEREIFSRIAFVDYGYFYDLDDTWYYIIPGPFRIKIPLQYISAHLNEYGDEFETVMDIVRRVASYILQDYYEYDPELRALIAQEYEQDIVEIREAVLSDVDDPLYYLWEHYRKIYEYFDDWVVVRATKDLKEISEILMHRKCAEGRLETIDWGR
ncbi:MAG: hypothetical protein IJ794_07665 [Lachnospiraceae bacterium]|nr:hypothetical protein [Lachnospiraceae bacterium]